MVKCFLLTKAAGPIGQSGLGWSYGKRPPRPSQPIMALERGGPDNFLPPNRHSLAAEPGSWLLAYPQLWSSAGGPILIGTLFYRKTALLLSNHHAQHTTPTHPRPHHSTLHSLAIVRSALSLSLSLPPVYLARGRVHSRSTSGKKKTMSFLRIAARGPTASTFFRATTLRTTAARPLVAARPSFSTSSRLRAEHHEESFEEFSDR